MPTSDLVDRASLATHSVDNQRSNNQPYDVGNVNLYLATVGKSTHQGMTILLAVIAMFFIPMTVVCGYYVRHEFRVHA